MIGLILYGPSRPKSESLADMDLLMLFRNIVDFVSICLFVCTAVWRCMGCVLGVLGCVSWKEMSSELYFGMVLGFGMCGLGACVFQRFCSIACFIFFFLWLNVELSVSVFGCYVPLDIKLYTLTGGNWQKWKRVFLTCHCHKIYRDEAVGLKSCKNTWKITIFVKMWNLGQYREIWYFVNNCLIKARI